MGINRDNSNDGCFQFQRESWPARDKNDFKYTTTFMDSVEKIFQVLIKRALTKHFNKVLTELFIS